MLLDPDKLPGSGTDADLQQWASRCEALGARCFLVGGSILVTGALASTVSRLKRCTARPVILFPGTADQVCAEADGLLFLSVISGRNAELLIGQQVQAAARLQQMPQLEVIPTGYMLIEGPALTTVSYLSGSLPLPRAKPELAALTALAGELLGLQLLYLEGGSGAQWPVPTALISAVRTATRLPLVVGGGMTTPDDIAAAHQAGATLVVVGTALETDPGTAEPEPAQRTKTLLG